MIFYVKDLNVKTQNSQLIGSFNVNDVKIYFRSSNIDHSLVEQHIFHSICSYYEIDEAIFNESHKIEFLK